MIEEYTEKKASDHEFSNNNFSSLSSGRFTDLFEGKGNLDDLDSLQQSDDHKEVKIASEQRMTWKKDSIKIANATSGQNNLFLMLKKIIEKLLQKFLTTLEIPITKLLSRA